MTDERAREIHVSHSDSSSICPVMSDETYQLFCVLLKSRTGLSFSGKKRRDLERAVQVILQKTNMATVFELYQALKKGSDSSPVWETAIHHLTVNETYFFRNKPHFQALRELILPDIIGRHRDTNQKHLTIWSAGCSSGEEPYSVAMVLADMLPASAAWNVSIIGTDIKQESLKRARHGRYKEWSFRTIDRTVVDRFFHLNNGQYQLRSDIMRMVTFHHANLQSGFGEDPQLASRISCSDLIICRNVTIYFDRASVAALMTFFYEQLAPGGWLLVGESEPPPGEFAPFAVRQWKEGVYYQKSSLSEPIFNEAVNGSEISFRPEIRRETPFTTHDHGSVGKRELRTCARTFPGLIIGETGTSVPAKLPDTSLPASFQTDRKTPDEHRRTAKPLISPISAEVDGSPPAALSDDTTIRQAFRFADAGQLDDAEQLCLKILEINGLSADVYYLLAMIAMARDEPAAAERFLKKVLYLDGDYMMAHYNLWILHQALERNETAARHLKTIEKLVRRLPPEYEIPHSGGMTVNHFRDIVDRNIRRRRDR